jgi:hypothetical protein
MNRARSGRDCPGVNPAEATLVRELTAETGR